MIITWYIYFEGQGHGKFAMPPQPDLLQELLQLSNDGITDLLSGGLASEVARADARLDDVSHSGLDELSFSLAVERVLEEKSGGEDGCDGVDDALAGDVGGGAYGFVLLYWSLYYMPGG